MANNYYMYVIRCADNSLYTGYTNDVVGRFKKHEEGKGAKYTRGRAPLVLEFVEPYETKGEAMKAEYAFKQLTKREKELFIKGVEKTNVAAEKLRGNE